ncbi:MAG TPA: VOC family protein [Burkholderiales bacterium]|nr:VOC family protein [Burkholderiales bacterium]
MIRNLQHIALAVPDPSAGKQFYTDFGMEGRDVGNSIVMRCAGRDQDQVVLVEGRKKRQHHVCFGTRAADLDALKKRLEQEGVKLVDAPKETPGDGIWFRDPDGLLVNVRVAEGAPWRKAPEWKLNTPGCLNRSGTCGHPKRGMKVQPTRLGHTLRFTPQVDKMLDFYLRVVGLQLSDRAQDIVAFMRVHGNSDHHVFGFIKSDRPGFHHASFEVENVDAIGMGACSLLDKGYKDGWGLGRHVIGSNFFHYIRDPWNSLAEYFCDIDYIPEGYDWKATNYAPEDALYVWGPRPPEAFGQNFE